MQIQVSSKMICPHHHCADIPDRQSNALMEENGGKKQGSGGEKAHLQMVRVGVYWQEHENTSAVSSGTQTAYCDWPDCSQELKPRSVQYN